MEVVWKDIVGFEGLYQVSNHGDVKSLERLVFNNGSLQRKHERILKPNKTMDHLTVILCKNGKKYPALVHRLVASAFIDNPENKPVVDHIDTNPRNNHVDNLRWVTTKENCMNPITRKKNSESKKGHPYYGRPFTEEEIEKIRRAKKGMKLSDEHKANLSKAHKESDIAKKSSQSNIKKAHELNKGKHRSEETKQKISAIMKGVHTGKHWKVVDGKRVWY